MWHAVRWPIPRLRLARDGPICLCITQCTTTTMPFEHVNKSLPLRNNQYIARRIYTAWVDVIWNDSIARAELGREQHRGQIQYKSQANRSTFLRIHNSHIHIHMWCLVGLCCCRLPASIPNHSDAAHCATDEHDYIAIIMCAVGWKIRKFCANDILPTFLANANWMKASMLRVTWQRGGIFSLSLSLAHGTWKIIIITIADLFWFHHHSLYTVLSAQIFGLARCWPMYMRPVGRYRSRSSGPKTFCVRSAALHIQCSRQLIR